MKISLKAKNMVLEQSWEDTGYGSFSTGVNVDIYFDEHEEWNKTMSNTLFTDNIKIEYKGQKLMAFWRYDQFPYYLCGEVDHFKDDGMVYVKSYQGSFKPVAIFPYEKGEEIKEELECLKGAYDRAHRELKENFEEQAQDIVGNLWHFKK